MIHLVNYDIPASKPGDRRRNRLARFLAGHGLRVQYSLFEIECPPEKLPAILAMIEQIIDPGEDHVRIYPICSACRARSVRAGIEAVCEHVPLIVW